MPSCIKVCNTDDKVIAWKKQTDGNVMVFLSLWLIDLISVVSDIYSDFVGQQFYIIKIGRSKLKNSSLELVNVVYILKPFWDHQVINLFALTLDCRS